MLKKLKKDLSIVLASVATALCFLCVCVAVLVNPDAQKSDTKTQQIEYTPPAQDTEYILIDCAECTSSAMLILDFELRSASLVPLQKESADELGYTPTAKIIINESLVSTLADSAGGINLTLNYDTPLLEAGNWRLTGNQVWQFLHLGDSILREQLLHEFFYTAFMFGLQNNQIYIILDNGICEGLSYSRLYNIAYYSKDWLSQLTVIS